MQKKANKNAPIKKARLTPEARARRLQQVFFVVLASIMIISMIIALVAR
jgi:hypothetical protein